MFLLTYWFYSWPVAALHGDKNQHERETVLADFRTGRVCILVATDIAARGLGNFFIKYLLPCKKKMFDTIVNTRSSCTIF